MKRAFKIEGTDTELVISRHTKLHLAASFINVDELQDGTYRLEYAAHLFPDFKQVEAFVFEGLVDGLVPKQKHANITVQGTSHEWALRTVSPAPMRDAFQKKFIRWEMAPSGMWRMVYSEALIPNPAALSRITVVRED